MMIRGGWSEGRHRRAAGVILLVTMGWATGASANGCASIRDRDLRRACRAYDATLAVACPGVRGTKAIAECEAGAESD